MALTLSPVLAADKSHTQSDACLNNLHRLGTAVHMYAADNNDEMVYPNWGTVNRWTGWLFTGVGASLSGINQYVTSNGLPGGVPLNPSSNPNSPAVQSYIYQRGALYPYIQQVSPYWCPAQDTGYSGSQWYHNVFQNNGPNAPSSCDIYSTYVMNGAVVDFSNPGTQNSSALRQGKLSNVHFHPNYVLMWEPNDTAAAYNDGSSRPSQSDSAQPSQRHVIGCPLLRIDGAGEMQQYNIVISQMSGFFTSPTGIVTATPFENEFFYAPGFIDGGYADANGAAPTR